MNYEEAWKSLYDQIKERISEDEKGKKSYAYLDVLGIMTRLEDDIGRIENIVTGEELLKKIEREYMWLMFSTEHTHYDLDIAFGAIRYYVSKFLLEQDSRPTEHWIFEKGDGKTCVDGYVCSACNKSFHTHVPYFAEYKYCPNCGCRMVEPQESEVSDADNN